MLGDGRAHLGVDLQVCPAEPVDRLLRIANQKQLARLQHHCGPLGCPGLALGEEKNNLGLERVGVLELID